MKTENIKQNEGLPIESYKNIMIGIEFMQNYIEDPYIFNPDSSSLRNFLIQSFTFLYPDFHYLSFVSKEDVDGEIIKVSQILQLLPSNNKKEAKLFDNMSKDEINKFWLRFFSLFTKQDKFKVSSECNIIWENESMFFKDVKRTLSYINYETPILNEKKLNSVNVDKEIDNWKQPVCGNSPEETALFNTDKEEIIDVDIKKLIIDLNHVVSMYNKTKKPTPKQYTPEYMEFFKNFITISENILQYRNNLSIIGSPLLDEINFKMLSNDLSGNLYYIKRCNNFIRTLKSKIKSLI